MLKIKTRWNLPFSFVFIYIPCQVNLIYKCFLLKVNQVVRRIRIRIWIPPGSSPGVQSSRASVWIGSIPRPVVCCCRGFSWVLSECVQHAVRSFRHKSSKVMNKGNSMKSIDTKNWSSLTATRIPPPRLVSKNLFLVSFWLKFDHFSVHSEPLYVFVEGIQSPKLDIFASSLFWSTNVSNHSLFGLFLRHITRSLFLKKSDNPVLSKLQADWEEAPHRSYSAKCFNQPNLFWFEFGTSTSRTLGL